MPSTAVKYEPFDRIILFGGTSLMGKLYDTLQAHGHHVAAYTSPRQAADCDIDAPFLNVCEDINASLPLSLISAHTLGIGVGEAWQFGPEIRAAFGDRLIDFMSIPYPRYLGGAHLSHAILNDEQSWGCCMQLVTENTRPGVVHDGAVIDAKRLPMRSEMDAQYLTFILTFVRMAHSGVRFSTTTPEEDPLFYPRLNTAKQGWINWSWTCEEIDRFVDAFGHPNPGARTTCSGCEVVVIDSDVTEDFATHPFHNGLIVDRYPTGELIVSAPDGLLCIRVDVDWLKPGMRLYTTQAQLEAAMLYTPDYTPTGDANAR